MTVSAHAGSLSDCPAATPAAGGRVPIHPVILSGGSGTRLWPLSRTSYPKQLLPLAGDDTLLQQTVLRAAQVPGAQPPVVVCNHDHRFLVREQLQAQGVAPACVILEPTGRNTAPAIALAALHLATQDPQALMLVLPADHVVNHPTAFHQAVTTACAAAVQGRLCTFGLVPTGPETGYGYMQLGHPLDAGDADTGAHHIAQFVEKPKLASAQQYLAQGGYLWNSGMFVFSATSYLEALQQHRPDILQAVQASWADRQTDLDFVRPGVAAFEACPAESIDYAVMQTTDRAAVVPARFGWSDVGSWHSLWDLAPKDPQGNSCQGDVLLTDTRNSLVRAQDRLVALVGLDNVVVIDTPDAVLVMHRDLAQNVKHITTQLAQAQRPELHQHRRVHRPWGWYEGVDRGERFQVKRLMVNPGGKLSLQKHHHRAEHWVVVSGTALVTVNGTQSLLSENQSTYIPLGHTHRLENPGKLPLHLIEVQSGSYLGEDDIVRLDDAYQRTPPPCTP